MRVSSAQPIIAAPRGQQPRSILQLIVLALNKRRIPGRLSTLSNRSLVAVLRLKKKPARSERKRADAARICEQGLLNPARLVFGDELPTVGNQRGGRLITIGEVSVGHRKMRPNRYRGSDVDQGTYDGEPFSTYNERPVLSAGGNRRRRLLSEGRRRERRKRSGRSRTAILAAVLARPQSSRTGLHPLKALLRSGGAYSQRVGAMRSLLRSRTQAFRTAQPISSTVV
jgi:hypothetical protein